MPELPPHAVAEVDDDVVARANELDVKFNVSDGLLAQVSYRDDIGGGEADTVFEM